MAREPTNGSGQASDVPSPNRKPKKRVGWHSSSNSGGEGGGSGASNVGSGDHSRSPLASPGLPSGITPPGALDARELSLALTKVLSDEREHQQLQRQWQEHQHQQQQQEQHSTPPPPQSLPILTISEPLPATAPKTPRPALRRNTSYDAPEERKMADWAEQRATQRQLRSLTDARQRADLLAMSVSAPDSRRASNDFDAAFQPLIGDPDGLDRGPAHDAVAAPEGKLSPDSVKLRTPHSRRQVRALENDHAAAETLVRSHTVRDKSRDLFHPKPSLSGTQTPTLHQAYTQDYVPRPSKYRGGILSSLLKLYNDDRRPSGGSNSSGYNTPSNPSTPLMSPRPSPPPSRPASTIGGSGRRPSTGGLFSSQRALNSTTSLSEFIKSSSMFAAPGGGELHDQWTEKLRKDRPSKPKKDQIRITVHIAGIISRHRYLLKLCRALMMYGAPTHRLEEYMTMSSRVLEIEGQFLYIPSCMLVSFDDSTTHTTEVKVVRVPQGIDLGKLRDVHNVYKDVVHDKLGVEEATRRLDEVMQRRPKFHTWLRVPVYGIASACVAPFAFEGRLIDLPIAFILGCIVGLLQLVFAPSNELYAHVFEVSAAVITSFLARGFGSIHQGQLFCFSALAQSSIALILPGYMVLCSSLELQSHNIVAGSVRMVHAMIYTLFLGYGITIGASLYGMMDKNAASETHCQDPLTRGWYFLFVPGFTLCLCIINQAKWRQTPVMTIMALAGFCVNSYCSKYFEQNTQISNMLGALTVGILANLYSRLGRHVENFWLDVMEWWEFRMRPRFTKKKPSLRADSWSMPSLSDPESRPGSPEKPQRAPRKVGYSLAAAAMLPAIFVQVPSGLAAGGSLLAGVTSANALNGNTSAVAESSVAIGISVGLFMSALIVYPLGKRRSGLFSF
ncbi:putative threonine/serine exporter domain-containing protein [Hirsutella rhossiliensis]|uniref:Threonine/serine exporter domain-containing protein n=1 Tax=Hirsutella rhossiliensis TaxID=111463 RepID=A0A9P8MWQ0_9HYPO|nr:putative threonine/serine exporter domain-containing protein [Hirsutella rhossiliensis]KAH0962762.1 putative threonine/serine exporter domain-containing protein [Hirsutella rhossiliensis]